jgi:signal transduction histidine kinase
LEVALQKPRSPEEYQEVMLSIYEDIKELQQLTRSLLDIAKTGSQGTLDLAEVRLDEVLLKAVGDIQRQNNQYKVRIDFEVIPQEENLMTVFGNANLLYIAFKNLIENGCKYSENKEAVITVSFLPNSIRVQIRNHGDVIAEADIENIFQPFFRADSAQFKPGFGLGLTLTRRILSLHKGTISVESAPYTGTLFQIELPNVLTFY